MLSLKKRRKEIKSDSRNVATFCVQENFTILLDGLGRGYGVADWERNNSSGSDDQKLSLSFFYSTFPTQNQ